MKSMRIKRLLTIILAMTVILAMIFTLGSCGNKEKENGGEAISGENASTNNEGETEEEASIERPPLSGDKLAVSLASEPDSLDPAINATVDGGTMLVHLFSGLAKWSNDENGNPIIVPDLAEKLVEGEQREDGLIVYTYTLRDGAKWSDGEPLTSDDFVYAWKRASDSTTGGAYYYLFDAIDGYGIPEELNVAAIDERTLEVTLAAPCSYWNELLAFPAFFPVRENATEDSQWAKEPLSLICNGPYKIDTWAHDREIVLVKNPNYHAQDSVKMEKIICNLTDDPENMLGNFKQGNWQFIDDVPSDQIDSLKESYPDEIAVKGDITTYYMFWNVNVDILPSNSQLTGAEAEAARSEIRRAIGLLIDRNHIINEIVRGGQLPASSFVAMGITDAAGGEFYENANKESGNGYVGYYDVSPEALEGNRNQAIEILKKYYQFDESLGVFTNVPNLTYLYNTSTGHQAIGQYLQQTLAEIGIGLSLEEQEFGDFVASRREGNYIISRNNWMADYNDPICFLEMWTTGSKNNDVQFGKGYNSDLAAYSLDLTGLGYTEKIEAGTWGETYDLLISKIRREKDKAKRYALLHKAEDMLMDTGCICPLFYFTDIYMLDNRVKGFYSNPLGYKYFMNTTISQGE